MIHIYYYNLMFIYFTFFEDFSKRRVIFRVCVFLVNIFLFPVPGEEKDLEVLPPSLCDITEGERSTAH